MPLLQWCSLRPQGPSNLAAIRFSAPIRISSLKIFPKGAAPFTQAPDVVAETVPEAFFLDIFFNAHPLDKENQRAQNALVPTSLAYAGGQMDFAVEMGDEYATRLMIVKGDFEVLSMAIYGEVVIEQPPVLSYEPKPLPVVEPSPLSKGLDPANSADPKALAEKLLALMPNTPHIALVVRLMFCLKPSDEDWEDTDFPYIYADLDDKDSDFDLEGIVNSLGRPIRDDLSQADFLTLIERVNDFLGPQDPDQAYFMAKLLSIAAPQHPEMARTLLEQIDMESIFAIDAVDAENTLLCLLDACANRDIATHFNNETMLNTLESLQSRPASSQYVRAAAGKLKQMLAGWVHFEDALKDDNADFHGAVNFLMNLTTEENTTGIWLSCMLLHDDLNAILRSSPDMSPLHPSGLSPASIPTTPNEFVVLVRAFVGIVSVLSAWAWADSLGVDECRERILAVLSLWQDIDGYKDILNHLLHLRQLTRRLGWIISDSDPPRKSGIFAERLLMRLAEDPPALLQEELSKTILDLKQPLSFISEDDRLALRKIALVAEDGLPAAVEELLFTSDRPFSLRRLRTLRVSMAIIQKEIRNDEDNAELRVLNYLWDEEAHGLIPRLVDLLSDVSGDIIKYFEVEPVLEINHKLFAQLFETANDALGLINSISTGYPLTSRHVRNLTTAVLDLFTCSELVGRASSPNLVVSRAAASAKRGSLDTLLVMIGNGMKTETGSPNALVVLRTVLSHPMQCPSSVDPVHHMREALHLFDQLLPLPESDDIEESEPSYLVTLVLPKILQELKEFFELLDLDNRIHLIERMVKFDAGIVGVGGWLLTEELKVLVEAVEGLSTTELPQDHKLFLRHQVVDGIELLWRLYDSDASDIRTWFRQDLQSDEELATHLISFLDVLLSGHLSSPSLIQLIQSLAKEGTSFQIGLRVAIISHLLRVAQVDPTTPGILDNFLPLITSLPPGSLSAEFFPLEFGLALASFAKQATSLATDNARILTSLLEWAMNQENRSLATLKGLMNDDFTTLCDFCASLVPEKEFMVQEIRARITIDEDEVFAPTSAELQSEDICLSLDAIQDMFNFKEKRPSTPRAGNKTPDILGMVISPPTALLRSPAATGLTKTYTNNDFRQLRQVPSARLNTSRLPSKHVDDFETETSSPTLLPAPEIVMGIGPSGFSLLSSPSLPTLGLGL